MRLHTRDVLRSIAVRLDILMNDAERKPQGVA